MGRILAIDFGLSRCGLAITDPFNVFAQNCSGVETQKLKTRLAEIIEKQTVTTIVIGWPQKQNGDKPDMAIYIEQLEKQIIDTWPLVELKRQNEYNSSREAAKQLILAGVPQKKRKDKTVLDSMSAVVILQRYLDSLL